MFVATVGASSAAAAADPIAAFNPTWDDLIEGGTGIAAHGPAKGAAGFFCDGVLYVAGGFDALAAWNQFDTYTIATDTWADVGNDVPTGGSAAGAGGYFQEGGVNKLMVAGGRNTVDGATRNIYVYNIDTDNWTETSNVFEAGKTTVYMAMAYDSGRNEFIRIGGSTTASVPTTLFQRVDPTGTPSLVHVSPVTSNALVALSTADFAGSAGYWENEVWLLGGNAAGQTCYMYDYATDTWSTDTDWNMVPGANRCGYVQHGQYLYAFGGNDGDGSPWDNKKSYRFDMVARTWATLNEINTSQADSCASVDPVNNIFYIAKGLAAAGGANVMDEVQEGTT